MSGALVLASIPGMYVKSVAAKKNNSPVIRLNTTSIKIVKGKENIKSHGKNVKKLKKVTFTSKNKKVASVTAKGVIKAVKAGSTKIEVKVSYIPKVQIK